MAKRQGSGQGSGQGSKQGPRQGGGRRDGSPAAGWRPERPERPRPETQRAPERREPAEPAIKRSGLPLLYGVHSVAAAIANPDRRIRALYLTAAAAERIGPITGPERPAPVIVRNEDLARLVGSDAVHQGAVAEVHPLPDWDLLDIPEDGIVLVLDQVTDPHNVGAILRTAAAFGVSALVLTERHSPEATGVLAKTASGGLEHVPIVTVGNLSQALTSLGERGFWRIGLDSEGPVTLDKAVATRPLCLVLGAEGKGLRRLTRERCDALARLDVPGAIKSLNVSNAAAVALYAIERALAGVPAPDRSGPF